MSRRLLVSVVALAMASLLAMPVAGVAAPAGPPSIRSFSPSLGPIGTSVAIVGNRFTGTTSVTFNLEPASFTVSSQTHIAAIVPSGATTGAIRVTTPDGTATSSTPFVVTPFGAPTITSFSPTSGPVGTSVGITGTNLTGATSVTFNLVAASFTVNSATKITATVSAGATTGPIRVTTPLGTATSAIDFTVTAGTGRTGGRPLSASLGGAAEVPGPGDLDGGGSALVRVNPGLKKVCFALEVSGLTLPATGAQIHSGKAGVAGPVVVTLVPPGSNGASSGCTRGLDRQLLVSIIQKPSSYYVNVHTTDFPDGAVRGQLSKGFVPAGTTTLSTTLSGSAEVPGPGDPDGTGSATITLAPAVGTICFAISVAGITLPATGAHIHQGTSGVAGPIVVGLVAPGVGGSSSGCLGGVSALAAAIAQAPSGYYVNVHTVDFPGGAVRGQLS